MKKGFFYISIIFLFISILTIQSFDLFAQSVDKPNQNAPKFNIGQPRPSSPVNDAERGNNLTTEEKDQIAKRIFQRTGVNQDGYNFTEEDLESVSGLQSASSQNNVSGNSCFDYYSFGSIKTEIISSTGNISAGSDLNLTFNLKNENPYPVINGALYVKIMRDRPEGQTINAPAIVDQFFVKEGITMDANATTTFDYSWNIPGFSISGNYKIASYFVTDYKYNLSGLSFTDDVVGSYYDFKVNSERATNVEFDKDSVKINGDDYRFAAFPPQFEKNEFVEITADIVNETEYDEIVEYKWTTYAWDALKKENIVSEEITTVFVGTGERETVSYGIPETDRSVYLAVGESYYKGTKSIVGVRFVRQNVDNARINFPSLNSFPIITGQENTLFSCFHHSGTLQTIPPHTMQLTLTDIDGNLIDEQKYFGPVTGDMMLTKKEFIPEKSYGYVILNAELLDRTGNIIDSSEIIYDCSVINPDNCPTDSDSGVWIWISIGILLLIIVAVGIYFKIKDKKYEPQDYVKPVGLSIFFLFVLSASFLMTPEKVDAKNITISTTTNETLYYNWNRWAISPGNSYYNFGYTEGLKSTSVSVTLGAKVINFETGEEVLDGASVPVGTKLLFERRPLQREDISWFGTGYSQDSPYGYWEYDEEGKREVRSESGDGSGNFITDNPAYPGFNSNYSNYRYEPSDLPVCDPDTFTNTASAPGLNDTYTATSTLENVSFDVYIPLIFESPYIALSQFSTRGVRDLNNTESPVYGTEIYKYGFNTADDNMICEYYCSKTDEIGRCSYTGDEYGKTSSRVYADSILCTVTEPGSFDAFFNTTDVDGRFYYRYYDSRDLTPRGASCYGTTAGMRKGRNIPSNVLGTEHNSYLYDPDDDIRYLFTDGTIGPWIHWSDHNVSYPSFKITIPDQSIKYSFNATENNDPPPAPVITGPSAAQLNAGYYGYSLAGQYFNASSTDPDLGRDDRYEGDKVKYGFDWDNDEVVDTWNPNGTNYGYYLPRYSPGDYWYTGEQSATSSYNGWTTPGTKTIKVLAQDDKGANSDWTEHQIEITAGLPSVTFSFNYSTTTPQTAVKDTNYRLQWSSDYWADGCVATGDWSGEFSRSGSQYVSSSENGIKNYGIDCYGPAGTTTKAISVNYGAQPPTVTFRVNGGYDYSSPINTTSDTDNSISWRSTDANTCIASGDWTGTKSTSTSYSYEDTGELTVGNYSYTLICDGLGGTASSTIDLVVSQALQVSCYPGDLVASQDDTVTWYSDVLGGGAPFNYEWGSDDFYDYGSGFDTYDYQYDSNGWKDTYLYVYDSGGNWAGGYCTDQTLIDNPPTTPSVTGPGTGDVDELLTFNALSTDPDGDDIVYGFDWDEDDSVDEWSPSFGYVNSGEFGSADYSWPTPGVKTFQVLTQDTWGLQSGWAQKTVTISVPQCSDGIDNEGDSLIDIDDPECHADGDANNPASYNADDDSEYESSIPSVYLQGANTDIGEFFGDFIIVGLNTPVTLKVFVNNADTCTAGGSWNTNVATSSENNYSIGVVDQETRFNVTCSNGAGSSDDEFRVTVIDLDGLNFEEF